MGYLSDHQPLQRYRHRWRFFVAVVEEEDVIIAEAVGKLTVMTSLQGVVDGSDERDYTVDNGQLFLLHSGS